MPPHTPEPDSKRPERRRRRVRTDPPPGTDAQPVAEPERYDEGENDERLRGEKPPHY